MESSIKCSPALLFHTLQSLVSPGCATFDIENAKYECSGTPTVQNVHLSCESTHINFQGVTRDSYAMCVFVCVCVCVSVVSFSIVFKFFLFVCNKLWIY